MTRSSTLLLLALVLFASIAPAADVEYSTTGTMDTPATHAGDRDFWGSEFITRWENTTGEDVHIEEFGWPCGGWWSQFWYVWISDILPVNPYTLEFYGSFVATIEDGTQYPPSQYTYVDVSDEDIVIPAGAVMVFGYGNPGMGGQIPFNGVETWSWLDDQWDRDGDFNRTAILQFKGSFTTVPVEGGPPAPTTLLGNQPNPFNPSTTITYTLSRDMAVDLAVYSLQGRPVRRLLKADRNAGEHQVVWDGTDQQNRVVPSGVYVVRMVTEDGMEARKVVVAK
jgi:hypothetical protein